MNPILRDDSLPMGGFSRLVRGAAGPSVQNSVQIVDACVLDELNPSTNFVIADDNLVTTEVCKYDSTKPSEDKHLVLLLPEAVELKRCWINIWCYAKAYGSKNFGVNISPSTTLSGSLRLRGITALNDKTKSNLTWNNHTDMSLGSQVIGYAHQVTLAGSTTVAFELYNEAGIRNAGTARQGLGLAYTSPDRDGSEIVAQTLYGFVIDSITTGLSGLGSVTLTFRLDLYWQKMAIAEDASTLLDSRPWMTYDLAE